jgi:hypothetical protein
VSITFRDIIELLTDAVERNPRLIDQQIYVGKGDDFTGRIDIADRFSSLEITTGMELE